MTTLHCTHKLYEINTTITNFASENEIAEQYVCQLYNAFACILNNEDTVLISPF